MIRDLWRLVREAQLALFEDPTIPSVFHYEQIYEEFQLQVDIISASLGKDLPNEVLKWLSFKHWWNGPSIKKKVIMPPGIEVSQELLESYAIQGCPVTKLGPREPIAETIQSDSHQREFCAIRSVPQRIQKRHGVNRNRFQDWKSL
jgi:hypothetical protein